MVDLRYVELSELISELKNRDGIRSMEIKENEVHKVQAAGIDETRNRYIKGEGPAVILEIKGWFLMRDILNYLNTLEMVDPKKIKIKIKEKYDVSEETAEKLYRRWKKEYLKHGYKSK